MAASPRLNKVGEGVLKGLLCTFRGDVSAIGDLAYQLGASQEHTEALMTLSVGSFEAISSSAAVTLIALITLIILDNSLEDRR